MFQPARVTRLFLALVAGFAIEVEPARHVLLVLQPAVPTRRPAARVLGRAFVIEYALLSFRMRGGFGRGARPVHAIFRGRAFVSVRASRRQIGRHVRVTARALRTAARRRFRAIRRGLARFAYSFPVFAATNRASIDAFNLVVARDRARRDRATVDRNNAGITRAVLETFSVHASFAFAVRAFLTDADRRLTAYDRRQFSISSGTALTKRRRDDLRMRTLIITVVRRRRAVVLAAAAALRSQITGFLAVVFVSRSDRCYQKQYYNKPHLT